MKTSPVQPVKAPGAGGWISFCQAVIAPPKAPAIRASLHKKAQG